MQFFNLGLDHRAVFLGKSDSLPVFELTAVYATDGDTSDVGVVVQRSDEHLRRTGVLFRCRDVLNDGIHQVGQIGCRLAPVGGHPSLLSRAVECLKIKLIVGCVEVTHQVEHLFLNLVRTAVEFVHFIDHYNRLETQLKCFLQHKTGLRHGSFESIDE